MASAPTVNAQSTDIEQLQQEAKEKLADLTKNWTDVRVAYNNNNAMKLGDPFVYDSGVIITVYSVEISNEKPSNPELGGTLVRIDFTVDNQTDEEILMTGHDVDLYDGERIKTKIDAKDFWDENIAPGMKAIGSVHRHARNLGHITIVIGAGQWSVNLSDTMDTNYNSSTNESRNVSEADQDVEVYLEPYEKDSWNRSIESIINLQIILTKTDINQYSEEFKLSYTNLVNEIQQLAKLQIDKLTDTLKNIDPRISIYESISEQIEAIEFNVIASQSLSQMIDEIYQEAEGQNRAFTDEEISSIGAFTDSMIGAYSYILGDTPEEASLIFEVLNEY